MLRTDPKKVSTPTEEPRDSRAREASREEFLSRATHDLDSMSPLSQVAAVRHLFIECSPSDAMDLARRLRFGEREYVYLFNGIEARTSEGSAAAISMRKNSYAKAVMDDRTTRFSHHSIPEVPREFEEAARDHYTRLLTFDRFEPFVPTVPSAPALIARSFVADVLDRLARRGEEAARKPEFCARLFNEVWTKVPALREAFRSAARLAFDSEPSIPKHFSSPWDLVDFSLKRVTEEGFARGAGRKAVLSSRFITDALVAEIPALLPIIRSSVQFVTHSQVEGLQTGWANRHATRAFRSCEKIHGILTPSQELVLHLRVEEARRMIASEIGVSSQNRRHAFPEIPESPPAERSHAVTSEWVNDRSATYAFIAAQAGAANPIAIRDSALLGVNRWGALAVDLDAAVIHYHSGATAKLPIAVESTSQRIFTDHIIVGNRQELWLANRDEPPTLLGKGRVSRFDAASVGPERTVYRIQSISGWHKGESKIVVASESGIHTYDFGKRFVTSVVGTPDGALRAEYVNGNRWCSTLLFDGVRPDLEMADRAWRFSLDTRLFGGKTTLREQGGRSHVLPPGDYKARSIMASRTGLVITEEKSGDLLLLNLESGECSRMPHGSRNFPERALVGNTHVLANHLNIHTFDLATREKRKSSHLGIHQLPGDRLLLTERDRYNRSIRLLQPDAPPIEGQIEREGSLFTTVVAGERGIFMKAGMEVFTIENRSMQLVSGKAEALFRHGGVVYWTEKESGRLSLHSEDGEMRLLPEDVRGVYVAKDGPLTIEYIDRGNKWERIQFIPSAVRQEPGPPGSKLLEIADALLASSQSSVTSEDLRSRIQEIVPHLRSHDSAMQARIEPAEIRAAAHVAIHSIKSSPSLFVDELMTVSCQQMRRELPTLQKLAFPSLEGGVSTLGFGDGTELAAPSYERPTSGNAVLKTLLNRAVVATTAVKIPDRQMVITTLLSTYREAEKAAPLRMLAAPTPEVGRIGVEISLTPRMSTVPWVAGGRIESETLIIESSGNGAGQSITRTFGPLEPRADGTITIRLDVPREAPTLTQIGKEEYSKFLSGAGRLLDVDALTRRSVRLNRSQSEFLNSIESLPPHERAERIIRWVRAHGEYDLFAGAHSRDKNARLFGQRYHDSLTTRAHTLIGSTIFSIKHAGICGDFAALSCEMLRHSGIAAGVAIGVATRGTTLREKHRHAQPFVVWPDGGTGYRIIPLEPTSRPRRLVAGAVATASLASGLTLAASGALNAVPEVAAKATQAVQGAGGGTRVGTLFGAAAAAAAAWAAKKVWEGRTKRQPRESQEPDPTPELPPIRQLEPLTPSFTKAPEITQPLEQPALPPRPTRLDLPKETPPAPDRILINARDREVISEAYERVMFSGEYPELREFRRPDSIARTAGRNAGAENTASEVDDFTTRLLRRIDQHARDPEATARILQMVLNAAPELREEVRAAIIDHGVLRPGRAPKSGD